MSNKQIIVISIIFIGFGFAFGHSVGIDQQSKINAQLKTEYDELKENYDILEIQYKRDLEACYQQMGDMEDDYDVNNDGIVNSLDLLELQKYILNQKEIGD